MIQSLYLYFYVKHSNTDHFNNTIYLSMVIITINPTFIQLIKERKNAIIIMYSHTLCWCEHTHTEGGQ